MGNKSISFVEEVEGIKNQINKIDFQRNSLKNEKKEKKRKIADFYKPILDEKKEKEKEIDVYYEHKIEEKSNDIQLKYEEYFEIINEIAKFSVFNVFYLGPILADLMTKLEGEKFSFYTMKYSYEKDFGIWDHNIETVKDTAAVISKDCDREKLEFYGLNSDLGVFTDYYKENCLFDSVLCEEYPEYIKVYESVGMRFIHNSKLKIMFPFLEYQKPYVKDFIDYVIDIRIKHQIEKISKEQLEEFLNEFLKNYEMPNNTSQKTKKKVKKIDK